MALTTIEPFGINSSNSFTFGNVTATGNVTGNFFIGNGSQLTGLPEGYGNSNVAAYLPTYTGNLVSLTGNVTTTANISANYFLGNGSQLTGIQAGATTTFSSTAPVSPAQGDIWIDADTAVQYIYFNDGTSSQWAEMEAQTSIASGADLSSVAQNIVPSANITYDLGSTTYRWRDIYLSGNTINLGGATIKTDAASGAIALIPEPTVANPNPSGMVVSPSGGITVVATTGGEVSSNAIANAAASPTAAPVPIDITTTAPVNGQALIWNAANSEFVPGNVSGGGGTPGGSNTQIQFNNAGAFGGTANLTWNGSELAVIGSSNITGNLTVTSTGFIQLPVGNTAQRPSSPVSGMVRFNSTTGEPEWYNAERSEWLGFNTGANYAIDYLVVAGGGGGGCFGGGGGGAGGYQADTTLITRGVPCAITVGAGGAGTSTAEGQGASGINSSMIGAGLSISSSGGGGGGSGSLVAGTSSSVGVAGASGGGGGGRTGKAGGSGILGQGRAGGASMPSDTGGVYAAGGGGGASAVGVTGLDSGAVAGAGGAGTVWGNSTTYAGGGGGGAFAGTPGAAGAGGGGAGGATASGGNVGGNGTANTGGGGGGGTGGASATPSSSAGGTGGSGVVIIRYPGTQRGTGGTVSSAGGYTYHTFITSGTFTA